MAAGGETFGHGGFRRALFLGWPGHERPVAALVVDRGAGGVDVGHNAARGRAPAGLQREADPGLVPGFADGDHADGDQPGKARGGSGV